MKQYFLAFAPLLHFAISPFAQGVTEVPAPAFLPIPPSASKNLHDYTAADVFSVICRRPNSLPAEHPFRATNFWMNDYIKKNWPGAKSPDSMTNVFQIYCDSDDLNIGAVSGNVEWFLTRVMDVPEDIVVQKIIQFRSEEVDPLKKLRMTQFGKRMFLVYYDPQLLFWSQEELNDASLLPAGASIREGIKNPPVTRRKSALKERLDYLGIIGIIADKSLYSGPDEEANCQNMKNLIEVHWNDIVQKCNEKKADPARKMRNGIHHTWSAPSSS